MNGLMTEREWRKQTMRRAPRPDYWGAQCVIKPARQTLKEDKAFRAFLILLSLVTALTMPLLAPRAQQREYPQAAAEAAAEGVEARSVSVISYTLPQELNYQSGTYTYEQLLRGKMLLIDEQHPLPQGVPAPNTMSVASFGKGMVPVHGLNVRSGRETIAALTRLFTTLRERGVSGLSVWKGTLSAAEQRAAQIAAIRSKIADMPLKDALSEALAETDPPGVGELQQEYTVEIRLNADEAGLPDEQPLERTEQGRALLQLAWRSGFVRREPREAGERAFRFRYVGEAHATAMTYLDLTFEEYLEWLHLKGQLAVWRDGALRYIILCKPITGTYVAFSLPVGATYEASLDNEGYAIVACTLGTT